MSIRLRLLGSPEVLRDGNPVRFDTRKATALLGYLAVTAQQQSRETVATLLWPEHDQHHAAGSMRRTLSVARSGLGDRGLVTSGRLIALDPAVESDVDDFRRRMADVRDHHPGADPACEGCRTALREAASLHRGLFLDGFSLRDSPEFDDWQASAASELALELDDALRRLTDAALAVGDLDDAVHAARRRVALDPLQEAAHAALMLAHARQGDRTAALRQYRECVRVLDEELGVTPLPETTSLHEQLLAGEWERPVPADRATQSPRPPARPGPLPFVGRDLEVGVVTDAWTSVTSGGGRLVLVEGEPGIGKTRLVSEALQPIQVEHGARLFHIRCFEGESVLAFAALAAGLARLSRDDLARLTDGDLLHAAREVAQLVPHLVPGVVERPAATLDEAAASRRTIDGLASAITALVAGPVPGVVWIDDAQWADHGTASVIGYLARRLDLHDICIIIGRRSAREVNDQFDTALGSVRREGRLIELALDRLRPLDVEELVGRVTPSAGADVVTRLADESEGNPFYLAEYLARADPWKATDAEGSLPPGIRALVLSRLANVDELERQVLAAAAILGRSFDGELVRRVSGRAADQTVEALERLGSRGLLVEREGPERRPEWEFDHDKTRAVMLDEMALTRRRLLHLRAAKALEHWHLPGGRRPLGLIAEHLASASDPMGAARWYRLAGDEAAGLHANADALGHYRTALALAPKEADGLRTLIGDLETLEGDYRAALTAYQAEAASVTDDALRRLEHRMARVHLRMGEWTIAATLLESLLDSLPPDAHAQRASVLTDASLAAARNGSGELAGRRAADALQAAERAGDAGLMAEARNQLGMLARHSGQVGEARHHLTEAVRLAEDASVPTAVVASRNNLARLALDQGQLDDAERLTREALEVASAIGDRHREAALRTNLADVLHAAGRRGEAVEELKRSVTLFADVGEPGSLQPEVWKLVEW